MTTHLIIPDSHANPDYDNTRFAVAGRYILDTKPDVIINLGDMADMASLCSYDRGKKCFEGRRVKKDLDAVYDANQKLWSSVNEYNTRRRKNGDKQYKPRKVMLLGNHCDRISRAIEMDPELDGLLSLDDLKYKEFGWEVIPYKDVIFIDGIAYSHHFPTGNSGNAISGVNIGRSLLQKNYMSSTVGHSHLRDYYTDVRADGKRISGLSAGCWMDYNPDYAKDSCKSWWRGLTLKHDVDAGSYEPEFQSLDMLQRRYG